MSGFAPIAEVCRLTQPWVRWAHDVIAGVDAAPPDEDLPVERLAMFRAEPLVFAALSRVGDPRRSALEAVVRPVAASNLVRQTLLCDALAPLADAGIRYAVYKGAAMTHVHADLRALRPVSDVDVMVSPGDFRRARKTLRAAGFEPDDPPQPVSQAFNNERCFVRPGPPRLYLDLHRGLHRGPLFAELAAMTVRSARRVDGVWVASDALAPLLIAAHRAKHGYSGDVRELYDFQILLERLPADDLAGLPRTAEKLGMTGALYCAWTLARWWFGHGPMAAEAAYTQLAASTEPWRDTLDMLASMDSPSDADKPWRSAPFLKMYLTMPLLTEHVVAPFRLAATHAVLRAADVLVGGPGVLNVFAVRRASKQLSERG